MSAIPRPDPPLERVEQQRAIHLFKALGATVYPMSQYRASHVAIGIPDLWVMLPNRALAWYWETKRYEPRCRRADGQVLHYSPFDRDTWRCKALSEAQQRFREHCLACGIRHYWGGFREAEDALIDMGLAIRGEYAFTLTPMRRSA